MNKWHIGKKSPDFINLKTHSAYKTGNSFQGTQRWRETEMRFWKHFITIQHWKKTRKKG